MLGQALYSANWNFGFQIATDNNARDYQPVSLKLRAKDFGSTVPTAGQQLYTSLTRGTEKTKINSQIIAITDSAGAGWEVSFLEKQLGASTTYTYELLLSTSQIDGNNSPTIFRKVANDSGPNIYYGKNLVYHYRTSYDPKFHTETKRAFHHLAGSDGTFITKALGGTYDHQRGVYIGFDVTPEGGTMHGYWTINGGSFVRHDSYLGDSVFGSVYANLSSIIKWETQNVADVIETRKVKTWWVDSGIYIMDFHFTLESPTGKKLTLTGNTNHAGVGFRASEEVFTNKDDPTKMATFFTKDGKTGVNYEGTGDWIVGLFPVHGVRYGVMVMRPTRDRLDLLKFQNATYGRINDYFQTVIDANEKRQFFYRYIIFDRNKRDTANIARAFTSYKTPVAVSNINLNGTPVVLRASQFEGMEIEQNHNSIAILNKTTSGDNHIEISLTKPDGSSVYQYHGAFESGVYRFTTPSSLQGMYILRCKINGTWFNKKLMLGTTI